MESNWPKRDEDITMVSNSERILCSDHRAFAASSTATLVGDPTIAPPWLEAALDEVVILILRADGEEKFDGLADSAVQGERLTSIFWLAQYCSPAQLKDTSGEQIASIPAQRRKQMCDCLAMQNVRRSPARIAV